MKQVKLITLAILGAALVGCSNIGNAPEGMSAEDAKKAFESQPIEEQIKQIENSPTDAASKAKRIAELRAKAGK